MTIRFDMSDAPQKLRELVETVCEGGEVLLSADGRVIAKITSAQEVGGERVFGEFAGKIHMSDDFAAPLSEDELREWEK
jgi:antitoxin (DNA-binding transcriptional repressor) of toxin-antitoxin stability system